MNINYYNILGIDEHSEDEDIRRAYKRLAVIWHPDKHQDVAKDEAEIKFKQISEAYSVFLIVIRGLNMIMREEVG
jgi:DnaJ family protein B protein 4